MSSPAAQHMGATGQLAIAQYSSLAQLSSGFFLGQWKCFQELAENLLCKI